MKKIIFYSLFSVLLGCSTKKITQEEKVKVKDLVTQEKNEILEVSVSVKPGEVIFLKSKLETQAQAPHDFFCEGSKIPSFNHNDTSYGVYVESYFSKFSDVECVAKDHINKKALFKIKVMPKDFPAETLTVDRKRVFLSKKDLARVQRERVFKDKVYASSADYPLFNKEFIYPIRSIVTSIYGSKRIFNDKNQTQHLGTDYRAAVGDVILSSNRGKIVMARDLFYTGNTVVIDHGIGIFTIYAHMSELKVTEGDFVEQGDTIGLAGATGRVTGPHLHWGVLINSQAIEGDSLVAESLKIYQP